MELGKKIAKVAVTGALLLSAMLPAFAQNYTVTRYRNPVTGNVVERRTVTGPGERSTVMVRRHYSRRYYHRQGAGDYYRTPYGTQRHYYVRPGERRHYQNGYWIPW